MTLESVVFPHVFSDYNRNELPNMGGGVLEIMDQEHGRGHCYGFQGDWDPSCSSLLHQNFEELGANLLPETCNFKFGMSSDDPPAAALKAAGRRKRQRTKNCKNKEKVENQRMIHIAVERNRRKQMNDHLAVLRSLMPLSYVQRGDQASIIGGAINFLKELEQLLQSLEAQRWKKLQSEAASIFSPPSTEDLVGFPMTGKASKADEAIANIEVTMVERHANLKILSKRRPKQRPKQLVMMVVGLQNLQLTTLHLNVSAVDPPMVLYSFSVKLEDGCQLRTADEIANAIYQMLSRIEEEAI